MYLASDFKIFSTQSKYGDDFLHFKSVSVRQRNSCIFKLTIIYCKTNWWSYCDKYMAFTASCAHGTQIPRPYLM